VLLENAGTVTLNERHYPVRRTGRMKLKEVAFQFGDTALRGVEQNPHTRSRWAKLARDGNKVMQFLANGRYVASVADGKAILYHHAGGRRTRSSTTLSARHSGE
jgi:hypothetical protein